MRAGHIVAASPVVYALDDADAIVEVNDEWSVFALANDGDALLPPAILGRTIWDFVGNDTTAEIYRRLYQRVRAGFGPVRFLIRCDGPAVRRLLQLTVSYESSRVRCSAWLLNEQPREPVAILDATIPRSSDVVVTCSWCAHISNGRGAWLEVEDALATMDIFSAGRPPTFSHGICEPCSQRFFAGFERPSTT